MGVAFHGGGGGGLNNGIYSYIIALTKKKRKLD